VKPTPPKFGTKPQFIRSKKEKIKMVVGEDVKLNDVA
jgi:hypothetical protein